jgi:predicted methyltransferase
VIAKAARRKLGAVRRNSGAKVFKTAHYAVFQPTNRGAHMKPLISIAASACMLSTAFAGEIPANIQAAIDNPLRTEENRARDEDRKPGEVLAFYGVKEGMTVVDIASGGGYFSEILSGVVGPEGQVRAQNSAGPRINDRIDALNEHYAKFGNITLDITEPGTALPYEDNSVDMVLLSLIVHHFHYDEASGEAMPERAGKIYADVKRVLKPGGVFAVIEHIAAPGSSRAESAAWHRAPEATIIADVTSVGFVFDGGAENIHMNPDDDLKNVWYETGLRGKTTRMVHRYVKPAK